jgi:hypothetical protein
MKDLPEREAVKSDTIFVLVGTRFSAQPQREPPDRNSIDSKIVCFVSSEIGRLS